MVLDRRYVCLSVSVICFFGLSFVGWISGMSPFTCCKRAVCGALIAYAATSVAVKAINAILISAMIEDEKKHILSKEKSPTEGSAQ